MEKSRDREGMVLERLIPLAVVAIQTGSKKSGRCSDGSRFESVNYSQKAMNEIKEHLFGHYTLEELREIYLKEVRSRNN